MTLTRRQVTALLEDHGLRPSRALGQNFVVDPNTVRRIARLAGVGPGDRVIEIGAGLGSLTLALVETGALVTAIEVDRGVLPVLRDVVADHAVRVVEGDAMRLDWGPLLGSDTWTLVANLPYNVATPLIADLLDGQPGITRMLVMVQREVAERLAAGPGDDAYGAVSVKVRYWATAAVVGRVPATVFVPRPNVDSALVDIRRRARPGGVVSASIGSADAGSADAGSADAGLANTGSVNADPVGRVAPAELFALVRAGFAQRRKMLRRSLAGRIDGAAFTQAGVDPEARAEELDVADWERLAAAAGVAVGGTTAAGVAVGGTTAADVAAAADADVAAGSTAAARASGAAGAATVG